MSDLRGHVHDVSSDVIARGRRLISSVSCSHLLVDPTNKKILEDALEQNVMVCRVKTSRGWRAIDSETLAKKWMISPEIARWTLLQTTRCGIGTTSESSLSREFSTNNRQMRYK